MVKARLEKGGSTKIHKSGSSAPNDRGGSFRKVTGSARDTASNWSEGTSGKFTQKRINKGTG